MQLTDLQPYLVWIACIPWGVLLLLFLFWDYWGPAPRKSFNAPPPAQSEGRRE